MVILNIKCRIGCSKQQCCYEMNPTIDLYESQQEETKSAINLLFSNSSKLIASVTTIAPDTEIRDAYDVFSDSKKKKQNKNKTITVTPLPKPITTTTTTTKNTQINPKKLNDKNIKAAEKNSEKLTFI
jgi:hypothetical protein